MMVRLSFMRALFRYALLFALPFFLSGAAYGFEIQRVVSPKGVEAWLVESHETPIISLAAAWEGGARYDPSDKAGLAHLMGALLDKGAGAMDEPRFQAELEAFSIEMSFEAGRDALFATMQTLSANRDRAFELLRLAILKPRFDEDAVERARRKALFEAVRGKERIWGAALDRFRKTAFGEHPYARPVRGDAQSLSRITIADMERQKNLLFQKSGLTLVVAGDITAKALAPLLDRLFEESLFEESPKDSSISPPKEVRAYFSASSEPLIIPRSEKQSVIIFGNEGLTRSDPDYLAAVLVAHILGGNSASRLMTRVRSQRGLVYDVSTRLIPRRWGGMFFGSTETRRAQASETLNLIREEIRRLREEGPSPEEITHAKSYLIGSYLLFFDGSMDIAEGVLRIRRAGLGRDYIKKRKDLIKNLSARDLQRAARRILHPDRMLVVIAGGGEEE